MFRESPKHILHWNCTPGNIPEGSEPDVSGAVLEQKASQTLLARGLHTYLQLVQVVSFWLMDDLQTCFGKITELTEMSCEQVNPLKTIIPKYGSFDLTFWCLL